MKMDNGQIILFQTQGGETKIEVRLSNETVWLTADQMAELFQRNKSTISRHIKNVLECGELQRNSVVAENATTASDGKTYTVAYYNLDMIISVGYRVNSHRGVQFRPCRNPLPRCLRSRKKTTQRQEIMGWAQSLSAPSVSKELFCRARRSLPPHRDFLVFNGILYSQFSILKVASRELSSAGADPLPRRSAEPPRCMPRH